MNHYVKLLAIWKIHTWRYGFDDEDIDRFCKEFSVTPEEITELINVMSNDQLEMVAYFQRRAESKR